MNKNKIIVCAIALILVGITLATCLVVTIAPINALNYISIPTIKITNNTIVDKPGYYLAHPDMIMNERGSLITMYPSGHGKGAVITRHSDDLGSTWSDRDDSTPNSWENSQETPTLYNLNFKDGSKKLLMVSGCPYWVGGYEANGFNYSISSDDGDSWSEFTNVYSPMDCIVAMSSLIHIKENGEYVDKWMGVFHIRDYTNYKTYLTFDENGVASWSQPEVLMGEHREIEEYAGLCELGIVRGEGEHSDTLIMLARANTKKTKSMISVSYDEGNTWSVPKELPNELCGERHKVAYDAVTEKYVVTFRQIILSSKKYNINKFACYGWVAWVGTFDNLIEYATKTDYTDKGDAMLLLGKDYSGSADCGYSGIVCKDGDFCIISYGYFKPASFNPFIMSVKFNLKDELSKIA